MSNLRRVKDLRLGTRFRYIDPAYLVRGFVTSTLPTAYVLLNTHGCGLCAAWDLVVPKHLQGIYALCNNPAEVHNLMVEVIDGDI